MAWEVEFTDQFEGWWTELFEADQDKIAAAVNVLADQGPNLKRPLVGKIEGATRHQHMKELIPPASSIRVLFAFDPRSWAILLLGGDKRGDWSGWYETSVPAAEALYDDHLTQLAREGLT